MKCDRLPLAVVEPLGDPLHLHVLAPAIGISGQLPLHVTGVEPGEAGGVGAIPSTADPVAGDAGIGRAGPAAAERDRLPVGGESLGRAHVRRRAGGECEERGAGNRWKQPHSPATPARRPGFPARLAAALPLLFLAACKPPPAPQQELPQADAARGLAAIQRAGCGACHRIPGLRWPQGEVGPTLDGLANQGLIAGRLPNRPDTLARFIRNAPSLVPGSAMPPMPVSEAEARDIAAYLQKESR